MYAKKNCFNKYSNFYKIVINKCFSINLNSARFLQQTVGQWQKVFWIAAGMLISTGSLYVIFAKSELQSWNSPKLLDEKQALETEMKMLKKDEEDDEDGLSFKSAKDIISENDKRKSICENNEKTDNIV